MIISDYDFYQYYDNEYKFKMEIYLFLFLNEVKVQNIYCCFI